jgi:hypothetical protein
MAAIQIKKELLPKRCEICHQSDCFDAQTNSCRRCNQIMAIISSQHSGAPRRLFFLSIFKMLFTFFACGLSAGIIFCAITSSSINQVKIFYNYDGYSFWPNWKFNLLAGVVLPLGLWTACAILHLRRSVNLIFHKRPRFINTAFIIFVSLGTFLLLQWCNSSWDAYGNVIKGLFILSLSLGLLLWVYSRRLYSGLLAVMIISIFLSPILSVLFIRPEHGLDGYHYIFSDAIVTAMIGYWLMLALHSRPSTL